MAQKKGVEKNSKQITPLGDRVLVRPEAAEEKTASGIIIPDSAKKEKPGRGKVVAVGPGKREKGEVVPVSVKVGDIVMFSKYGYDEVDIDGDAHYILAEGAILAVIR